MATLVWFRDDLRLDDHPALTDAASDPDGVVAVYVLDESSPETRPLGGAARWWLHHSLAALAAELRRHGVPLVLRRGPAREVVPALAREARADAVVWNRRYGPERALDADLKVALRDEGRRVATFRGGLLHEPWDITTNAGSPYRVFTAFWRACLAGPDPAPPLPAPRRLAAATAQPEGETLAALSLLPTRPDWTGGLARHWEPGETTARARLVDFLAESAADYARLRDVPRESVTSRLSPQLRWGELSPRRVWHEARAHEADTAAFLAEIGWREFSWHTLFQHPTLATDSIDRRFDAFEWLDPDATELAAWRGGRTGFGLVDAGMRELWETGTMHNRVRMVAASFLTKNLLVDWRLGEAWFWDTLVDADPASNPFNWQWIAGSGRDAAPYFRVFNPERQRARFDPDNAYVDRWAPDSAALTPLVDLAASRERALAAYARVRAS